MRRPGETGSGLWDLSPMRTGLNALCLFKSAPHNVVGDRAASQRVSRMNNQIILPTAFSILAMISGGWLVTSLASFSSSSAEDGSSSSFFLAASVLTASSFKVFANASRIVLTCSAGVFGGMT